MKNIICLILLTLSYNSIAEDSIRLSEPVFADDDVEIFGSVFTLSQGAVDLSEVMQKPNQYLGKPTVINTSIKKVCQKKGCFFISQVDDHVVRISFKDYGFFIPTDSTNKDVQVMGELIQTQLTEQRAKHYREDLGLSKDKLVAGDTYEFVATGIAIPK